MVVILDILQKKKLFTVVRSPSICSMLINTPNSREKRWEKFCTKLLKVETHLDLSNKNDFNIYENHANL